MPVRGRGRKGGGGGIRTNPEAATHHPEERAAVVVGLDPKVDPQFHYVWESGARNSVILRQNGVVLISGSVAMLKPINRNASSNVSMLRPSLARDPSHSEGR